MAHDVFVHDTYVHANPTLVIVVWVAASVLAAVAFLLVYFLVVRRSG